MSSIEKVAVLITVDEALALENPTKREKEIASFLELYEGSILYSGEYPNGDLKVPDFLNGKTQRFPKRLIFTKED